MSKLCPVTVTFSTPGSTPCRLKAKSITHARQVVIDELDLAAYTGEALNSAHVLHVYIFFNGKNHSVEAVDKMTSTLRVLTTKPVDKGRAHLKPKKLEKRKHNHTSHRIHSERIAMVA
jgi:hypothetical protein